MAGKSNYTENYAAKPDGRKAAPSKKKGAGRSAAQAKVKAPSSGAAEKKSRKGLVIGIVALVVVIAAAAVAYNVLAPGAAPESLQTQGAAEAVDGAASGGAAEGGAASAAAGASGKTDAPDFELTAPDGSTVSLSEMKGKPIVLNFWASTCGPCKMEMPEFQKAFEQYGDKLRFVMVNVPDFNGETRERALQLVEQSGYTFPVYFDDTMQGQVQYGITSIPQTYFINADGTVEAYASGAIDASTIDRGIAMLLGD